MNETIEEKELIESVERGEWKSIDYFEQLKKDLQEVARNTSMKDYRINIRISKRDVEALKTKAMEEGLPYQTLVTSILHKYVTGNLKEVS
jgi:predicted DNA binding CopG/RHH family protein